MTIARETNQSCDDVGDHNADEERSAWKDWLAEVKSGGYVLATHSKLLGISAPLTLVS